MKQWIVVGVLAWALTGGVAFAEDEEPDEPATAEESESKGRRNPQSRPCRARRARSTR